MEPLRIPRTAAPADHAIGGTDVKPARRLLRSLERGGIAFYRVRLQPDFRVETISSYAARLTGYPIDHLVVDPQLALRTLHPDDRHRLEQLLADPSQAAAPCTLRIVHRDGKVARVEHLAFVTRDERGPTRIEGALRDVTVMRTGGGGRDARGAVYDLPVATYLADAAGFVAISPSVEALTGFAADAWIDQPGLWGERLHPDDRARLQSLATAGVAGQAWQAEYRWLARDGRVIRLRQASAPLRDDHGELIGVHGLLLDGAPLQESSAASVGAQRMEALGRLAGVVAHDFNNLLTVILGHSEMLLDSFRDAGGARDSALEIKNAGEAGARIARQLLALSGRQSLSLQTIDLNEMIRDTSDTLHELVGGDVEVRFDLGSDLPPVECDVAQMQRVLRMLVADARDAMPAGGRVTISTRAVLHGERREIRLATADSRAGAAREPGVSPFEPSIVIRKPRGAGLNRAAIYGIITQLGGRISVDDAPGGGLVFTIGLPAKGS